MRLAPRPASGRTFVSAEGGATQRGEAGQARRRGPRRQGRRLPTKHLEVACPPRRRSKRNEAAGSQGGCVSSKEAHTARRDVDGRSGGRRRRSSAIGAAQLFYAD